MPTLEPSRSPEASVSPAPSATDQAPRRIYRADWEALPAPPIGPREGMSATRIGDEVLIWGGRSPDGSYPTDGAAFDTVTGAWSMLPPAPIDGRTGHATSSDWEDMVIWGGLQTADDGTATYLADGAVYDTETDAWTQFTTPVEGRATASMIETGGGEVTVFGGTNADNAALLGDGFKFRPHDDRITLIEQTPFSGDRILAVMYTGRLLVAHGHDGGDVQLHESDIDRLEAWEPLTELPIATDDSTIGIAAGRELIVLGRLGGVAYDTSDGRTRLLKAPPVDVGGVAPVWTHQRLIYPSEGFAFDPFHDRWTSLPDPGMPIAGSTAAWTQDRLVVVASNHAGMAALALRPDIGEGGFHLTYTLGLGDCAGVGFSGHRLSVRGDPEAPERVWAKFDSGPRIGIYAWPRGWTARFAPELVIYASDGSIAAREGTQITDRDIPGTLIMGCYGGTATSIAGYRPGD